VLIFNCAYLVKNNFKQGEMKLRKEITILVCIPDANDVTSFYRGIGPLAALRKTSDVVLNYIVMNQKIDRSMVQLCDIAFFQRPFLAEHVQAMQLCKDLSRPVWVDYDDDLFTVPSDNPTQRIYGRAEIQGHVQSLIDMADCVSVSTEFLKGRLQHYTKSKDKFFVIENGMDLNLFKRPKEMPKRENLIMWRGSPTHHRDVMSVADQIMKVYEKRTDYSWEFVGDRLWFLTDRMDPKRAKVTPPQPVEAYTRYIFNQHPRVWVTPLHDNVFNWSKSNIAWIEATYAGAVSVAPMMREWMQPGVFNYDFKKESKARFEDALLTAMDLSDEEQAKKVEASWDKVVTYYNLEVQNKKRMELIKGLL
jgi:hypothetical protein